jgi:hypothetical protein
MFSRRAKYRLRPLIHDNRDPYQVKRPTCRLVLTGNRY